MPWSTGLDYFVYFKASSSALKCCTIDLSKEKPYRSTTVDPDVFDKSHGCYLVGDIRIVNNPNARYYLLYSDCEVWLYDIVNHNVYHKVDFLNHDESIIKIFPLAKESYLIIVEKKQKTSIIVAAIESCNDKSQGQKGGANQNNQKKLVEFTTREEYCIDHQSSGYEYEANDFRMVGHYLIVKLPKGLKVFIMAREGSIA